MAVNLFAFGASGAAWRVMQQQGLTELPDSAGFARGWTGSDTLATLPPYLNWPGAKQICRIERQRTLKGKTTVEVVCAITSLCRREAPAEKLLLCLAAALAY